LRNSFKKIGLLLGALLLTIGLGSGMNNAFAGQDAGSSLINWFGIQKTNSEQKISSAITAEKTRLMGELKVALQEEKQRAKEELASFTEKEKQKRTIALQEYADSLIANMTTDLTEEKETIIAELDAEHSENIKDLNQPSTSSGSAPPAPEVEQIPEVKPESTPQPNLDVEIGNDNDSATKPGAETEIQPDSVPESDPTSASESE